MAMISDYSVLSTHHVLTEYARPIQACLSILSTRSPSEHLCTFCARTRHAR